MKRLLSAVLATVVLGGLVLMFLDMPLDAFGDGVSYRLARLAPGTTAAAFGIYLACYFGRALRFQVLLPGARGLVHLASIAARHNLLNLVLPFRTGEASLPLMLKSEFGRPLAEGTATLLVCRVLDLLCVFTYASIGLAWRGVDSSSSHAYGGRILGVLGAVFFILLIMRPVAGWVSRRLRVDGGRLQSFAARASGHLVELSTGRLLAAGAVSLATWLATYVTFYLLLAAMGGPDPVGLVLGAVDFPMSLLGTTGLHLSTVLPVNTVGGLGSWEAGWVAGYVYLAGMERVPAGISGLVSHLATFGFIAVIGGLGFLLRRRPGAGPAAAPDEVRPSG